MTENRKAKFEIEVQDSSNEIARVRKVIGQLEGIEKMISNKRHPAQVIQQVKAASSALTALRFEILKKHLQQCLDEAVKTRDPKRLVDEILEMQLVK